MRSIGEKDEMRRYTLVIFQNFLPWREGQTDLNNTLLLTILDVWHDETARSVHRDSDVVCTTLDDLCTIRVDMRVQLWVLG